MGHNESIEKPGILAVVPRQYHRTSTQTTKRPSHNTRSCLGIRTIVLKTENPKEGSQAETYNPSLHEDCDEGIVGDIGSRHLRRNRKREAAETAALEGMGSPILKPRLPEHQAILKRTGLRSPRRRVPSPPIR